MSVYTDNGFANRRAYLDHLADEYAISFDDLVMLAELLGPGEDFDGLVSTLNDMEGR